MAAPRKTKHAHGPSEVRTRPDVLAAADRELRLLGSRLRALREARGMTREAAAEAIGIHPVHVARLETGSSNVTFTTLVAVSMAFGVPLAALVAGTGAAGMQAGTGRAG